MMTPSVLSILVFVYHIDQLIDVIPILLRCVHLENDFWYKLHANPLAKLMPNPPGCMIQCFEAFLFFNLGTHHRNEYPRMPEIGSQSDTCDGHETDSPVFHVAREHQAYFLLDLQSQSLWSS